MNLADRTVIVTIKLVDGWSTTEFTMPRCNLNITDKYVSLKTHHMEIFRPWHQIKELKITEVNADEESCNGTNT